MKPIRVKSARATYEILAGEGLLEKAGPILKKLDCGRKALIVTQEKVARFHLDKVRRSLSKAKIPSAVHRIADGEEAKSERELFGLYHALVHGDFERGDMILALGGGVVGDLAGFAAATYLRGIPFVNFGTTLLAQVDSSIGGKTGINLDEGKNLVGAFYPPRLVVSDVRTLETLPEREFLASMGEVIKYGVIADAGLFRFLEQSAEEILRKNSGKLKKIVYASSRIKVGIVSEDEFETKGARVILNFGHTFGHAIEQALHYRKIFHGEAVAIGMACAARLAAMKKMFPAKEEARMLRLIERFHLPVSLSGLDLRVEDIMCAIQRDKKKKSGRLRFVLPRGIGKVSVCEGISSRLIQKAIEEAGHVQ